MRSKYFFVLICSFCCAQVLYASEDSLIQLRAVLEEKNKENIDLQQGNTRLLQIIRALQEKNHQQVQAIEIRDAVNEELVVAHQRNKNRIPPAMVFLSGGLAVSLLHTVFNIPINFIFI